MRRFDLFAVLLFSLITISNAQYWFQSGAQGDYRTGFNNGGSVQIQTISPQSVGYGSLAYWIGETLSNGAFAQVGYEIPNSTGYYQTNCTVNGCTGEILLQAYKPAWFWEYFPAASSGTAFYGQVGDQNSFGPSGSFNTYAMNSSGTVWSFYLNSRKLGSVDLGASDSGQNPIVAIGEMADALTNTNPMPQVQFKNLGFYLNKQLNPVPVGYTTISYGKGSGHALQNLYGVKEVNNQTNFFAVGSGLPINNQLQIWRTGYKLNIVSAYGAVSGNGNYTPFGAVQISAPQYVNISTGVRALFLGWTGSGQLAYTGAAQNATVLMDSNITETANWQLQYLVNVTSQYGIVRGAGWWSANQTANISTSTNTITLAAGKRSVITGWSNGATGPYTQIIVNSPKNITAKWAIQYLVSAATQYGNVTGNGWYNSNTTATLSLTTPTVNLTPGTRLAFYSWTNGGMNSSISATVNAPILISAIYKKQNLVTLQAQDAYGNPIGVNYFAVGGAKGKNIYVYSDQKYPVSYANYKGTNIQSSYVISGVVAPETLSVRLPVYNITMGAYGLFKEPIPATLNVTFWNGTRLVKSISGSLTLSDVPYGYAYGTVSSFGETRSISLSNGGVAAPVFLTFSIFESILIGLIIIYLMERIYFYEEIHLRRQREKERKK